MTARTSLISQLDEIQQANQCLLQEDLEPVAYHIVLTRLMGWLQTAEGLARQAELEAPAIPDTVPLPGYPYTTR